MKTNNETDSDNAANLQKYKNQLSTRGKIPTASKPLPKNFNLRMRQLAAEGELLLAEEEKTSTPPTPVIKQASPTNPYLRAHTQILSKLEESTRKEILEMERIHRCDNHRYDAFAKEVRILGDKLSNNTP